MEDTAVRAYLRELRLMFKSYLKRPDGKQPLLSAFQQSFNAVETDMRYDEETKAELHLRNEELRDGLWKLVGHPLLGLFDLNPTGTRPPR